MLEDTVASDCRRGPRWRHVANLGAAEDGEPVDLEVEGYVLSNAEGSLDRDELVAIERVVARNELSGGRSDLSVG
jgi:hypothetical protein